MISGRSRGRAFAIVPCGAANFAGILMGRVVTARSLLTYVLQLPTLITYTRAARHTGSHAPWALISTTL